jgi:hypothetical protein
MPQRKYGIPEAAQELQLSEAYIRMCIRNGSLISKMEPVSEGSTVMKHVITQRALDEFANRDTRRAPRRADGRAKWVFYASPEEVNLVKELLYTSNIPGLAVVAQSISSNAKGNSDDEPYVPPSKRQTG